MNRQVRKPGFWWPLLLGAAGFAAGFFGPMIYDSDGACADLPVGHTFRAFEKYDSNGPIRPPSEWPPGELEQFIHASPIFPVPARFDRLNGDGAPVAS